MSQTDREPEINRLLRWAKKHAATNLHLEIGFAPRVILRGVMRSFDMRPLTDDDLARLVSPMLQSDQRRALDEGNDVAFTYASEGDQYQVKVGNKDGQLKLSAHRCDAA